MREPLRDYHIGSKYQADKRYNVGDIIKLNEAMTLQVIDVIDDEKFIYLVIGVRED